MEIEIAGVVGDDVRETDVKLALKRAGNQPITLTVNSIGGRVSKVLAYAMR